MSFRSFSASAAAVLVAVAIAACGSSGPQTPSPANKVPANVALYVGATVQPSTSQWTALQSVIDKVGGAGTADKLVTKLENALAKPSSNGMSFTKDVQPWLGNQVGLALLKLPTGAATNQQAVLADLLLVAPTLHPSEAQQDLALLTKSGMPNGTTAKVSGDYVLFGGKHAVALAAATSTGNSLASTSSYKTDLGKVGSDSLGVLYVNPHGILQAELNAANGNAAQQQLLKPLLAQVPSGSSAMLGVSVTSSTVELNLATSGYKAPTSPGAPADVSGLPADSWLAVGTPAISAKQLKSALSQLSTFARLGSTGALTPKTGSHGPVATIAAKSGSKQNATSGVTGTQIANGANAIGGLQKMLPFLKSGLGPMRLSVAGFPNNGLKAGFSLQEPDSTTATGTVGLLYTIAHFAKANISGSSSSFSVTLSPKVTVDVGTVGDKVVATLGYPQASGFTSPGSTLASNSVYQAAVSQLPSGSDVPVFVNLSELSSLVSQNQKLADTKFAKALSHFSYLIVGDSPTSGTVRIVLGVSS